MPNPITETQMLIRKPASEVFNAFINPEITTNFWFTKSSGKLVPGRTVIWEWEMYNVSAEVLVRNVIADTSINIEWGNEHKLAVEFSFIPQPDNSTYVIIKESGYYESGDDLVNKIKNSTGGFTTVLDGLKAYLEHGINLHLIRDKFLKKN